jgi:hypothetical protein
VLAASMPSPGFGDAFAEALRENIR